MIIIFTCPPPALGLPIPALSRNLATPTHHQGIEEHLGGRRWRPRGPTRGVRLPRVSVRGCRASLGPGALGIATTAGAREDGAPASGPASSPPAAQPSSKNSDNKGRVSPAPLPRAGPSAGAAVLSREPCDPVGHVSPPATKGPSPRLT